MLLIHLRIILARRKKFCHKETTKFTIKKIEAISKRGIYLKVKAASTFNPQAYSSMSRT